MILASAAGPPVHAMDGAILVVSPADGPMPAAELAPRIKRALDATAAQYSETDLQFLSERAARTLASPRGALVPLEICVPAGSPCVVVARE